MYKAGGALSYLLRCLILRYLASCLLIHRDRFLCLLKARSGLQEQGLDLSYRAGMFTYSTS
jgi:hypothetical protein